MPISAKRSAVSPTTRTAPQRNKRVAPGLLPLIGGAAAWVSGQAVLPDMGLEWEQRLAAVAAARGAQELATVLLFVAGVLFVVAATALRTRTVDSPRPRLAAAGAVALGLGGVWLCAGRAAFNLQLLKATADGVDPASGLALLSASEGLGFVPFPLTLLALLSAPILLAAAAGGRVRTTWLPLGLWVIGIGAFMAAEFTNKPLEIAGIATANVGLVLAGAAHLRRRATADGQPHGGSATTPPPASPR